MSNLNRGDGLKVGVCGLFCERCPKLARKECSGCAANETCAMPECASSKGLKLCFDCRSFPCSKCGSLFQKGWMGFAGSRKVVG